jgi:hypothetical protein
MSTTGARYLRITTEIASAEDPLSTTLSPFTLTQPILGCESLITTNLQPQRILRSCQQPNTPISHHPRRHHRPRSRVSPGASPAAAQRPLADLYAEQAYLHHDLGRHDARARRLLLAAAAAASGSGDATLRARLAETARQEQLALLRLADLWLEIQARERWSRAVAVSTTASTEALGVGWGWQQPAVMASPGGGDWWVVSPGHPASAVMWSPDRPSTAGWSGESRGWDGFDEVGWGGVAAEGEQLVQGSVVGQTGAASAEAHAAAQAPVFKEDVFVERPVLETALRDSVKHRRRLSWAEAYHPQPRDKRMSLPTLRSVWPDAAEDGVEVETARA